MVDTPIGTNSPNYTLVSGDVGATIFCRVTATNASGSAQAFSNVVGPVAAAVELTPAMTNMWTWLKADAGVYLDSGLTVPATAEDALVKGWKDQGPGGHNFLGSLSRSVQGPTLKLNVLNSKPILHFEPAGEAWLNGPSMAALTAGEIFIVVKATDGTPVAADNNLWGFGTSGAAVLYPYAGGNIYDDWGRTTRPPTGIPSADLGTWCLYNVVSTPSEWTNFVNNIQLSTTATNTVAFLPDPGIGRNFESSGSFPGDIAEVIIYTAKCSAPDKLQTITYLSDKYALGIV